MSQTERSPGTATRAPGVLTTTTMASVPHWSANFGLRARRAAAARLEPLECGHRDPLDCPRSSRLIPDDLASADCDPRSSALIPDDLALEADYWHESWADRGVPEREQRGRELAAAGWVA